jgi:hypothetical protein
MHSLSHTQCPSFVADNPLVCHSERSEESRHFFALIQLSNAGILRFAQNDRRWPFLLRMTNGPYQSCSQFRISHIDNSQWLKPSLPRRLARGCSGTPKAEDFLLP